jgi:hypothetical protein
MKIPAKNVIAFRPSSSWLNEVIQEGRAKPPPKRPASPHLLARKKEATEGKAKQEASSQTVASS